MRQWDFIEISVVINFETLYLGAQMEFFGSDFFKSYLRCLISMMVASKTPQNNTFARETKKCFFCTNTLKPLV